MGTRRRRGALSHPRPSPSQGLSSAEEACCGERDGKHCLLHLHRRLRHNRVMLSLFSFTHAFWSSQRGVFLKQQSGGSRAASGLEDGWGGEVVAVSAGCLSPQMRLAFAPLSPSTSLPFTPGRAISTLAMPPPRRSPERVFNCTHF